ncbi:uncharacterized protein SOCE26_097700 [Sorangium cellulosum]|uniref:Uncharacterized protein n=1 Tax=Sorangium cellulosum TaxID=56 RepID=A0A2L0F9W2_SORCE|nr:uncharacterized protein SOCE26_097700 [Sorangium cellulosum]
MNEDETISATIQVKTRIYGSDGGWHMKKKHETLKRPSLFYVFVDLGPETPSTFVIPSTVVADVVRETHKMAQNAGEERQGAQISSPRSTASGTDGSGTARGICPDASIHARPCRDQGPREGSRGRPRPRVTPANLRDSYRNISGGEGIRTPG